MSSPASGKVFQEPDLVNKILCNLDFQDLFVARMVCRSWNELLRNQQSSALRKAQLLEYNSDPSSPTIINELLSSDLLLPVTFGSSSSKDNTELWLSAFVREVDEWPAMMDENDGLPISGAATWRDTKLASKPLSKVSLTLHPCMKFHDLQTIKWSKSGVLLFNGETLGALADWMVERLWALMGGDNGFKPLIEYAKNHKHVEDDTGTKRLEQ